jgi:hypothetical protein
MAITAALCNSYKGEIIQGIHLAADVYKIALYVSAATLDKTTTVYSATNEVANGNGYATGGGTLSGFAVVQVGDRQVLKFTDQAWAAATITARGALIYNSTRSNKAVAVLYFGASDIVSTNGTFTVDLGQAIASAQSITFTSNNTITRASGSFVSDGFVAGHTIVTDDSANPGPFTIATVAALTLTTVETTITNVSQATKTVSELVAYIG